MAFITSIPVASISSTSSNTSFKTNLRESKFVTTPNTLRVSLNMDRSSVRQSSMIRMQETDLSMGESNDLHDDGPMSSPPQDADAEERIPEDAKLFVGNLSWNTTDTTLGDAFESFGKVIDSRVITDKFTGKSRGFGFIEFDNGSSAQQALTGMDGVEIDGRAVRVDRANRRANNGGSGQRRERY